MRGTRFNHCPIVWRSNLNLLSHLRWSSSESVVVTSTVSTLPSATLGNSESLDLSASLSSCLESADIDLPALSFSELSEKRIYEM